MNELLIMDLIVPSSVVLGGLPQIKYPDDHKIPRPKRFDRTTADPAVRQEMDTIMSLIRFNRDLRHSITAATDVSYILGDFVRD